MSIVWLDGELVDKADAKVGVADHGLLFGDLVSEDMRAYGGRVFRLRQHLDRLDRDAADRGLVLPTAGDSLAAAIDATLKANHRTAGFVKVVVTRGAGPLTPDPRKCVPVTIILAEEAAPYPRELYDCGLDVWASFGPSELPSHAKLAALRRGCLEGLRLDGDGRVSARDGAVGWVLGGRVQLEPWASVTVEAIAELTDAGCRTPTLTELLAADEVFLASTAAEVIAVRSIDGKPVGGGTEGPVVKRLRAEFATMVRRECAVDWA